MRKLFHIAAVLLLTLGTAACDKTEKSGADSYEGWWKATSMTEGGLAGLYDGGENLLEDLYEDGGAMYIQVKKASSSIYDVYLHYIEGDDRDYQGPYKATLVGDDLVLTEEAISELMDGSLDEESLDDDSDIPADAYSASGVVSFPTSTTIMLKIALSIDTGKVTSGETAELIDELLTMTGKSKGAVIELMSLNISGTKTDDPSI